MGSIKESGLRALILAFKKTLTVNVHTGENRIYVITQLRQFSLICFLS